MTASQRPGDGRVEAAARHWTTRHSEYLVGLPPRYWVTCRCGWAGDDLPDGNLPTTHRAEVAHYLAAADLWDREHGYVRVKLDEFRQWVLDQAYSPDDIVLGSNGLTDDQIPDMHRLLDLIDPAWRSVLREAAEQVGGNG